MNNIAKLEDRIQISELLNHYCWLFDSRQPEKLRTEVYTDDASDHHGDTVLSTVDEIEAFMTAAMDWSEGHVHTLGNVTIELDGDTATARSYVSAWHWYTSNAAAGADRPADFACVGQYHDELRREPQGWRIAKRTYSSTAPGNIAIGTFPTLPDAN